MQVYLNGAKVGRGGMVREGAGKLEGLQLGAVATDLRLFDIASLEAVEVYRSAAQVPQEYGGPTAACGVLLLWTRQGP